MPSYYFEAMDQTGQEIKDVIEAAEPGGGAGDDQADGVLRHEALRQEEPQDGRRQRRAARKGKTFALGGVGSKALTTFTRQLSILQDAGLPILRSLRILEQQCTAGALKNALIDVCEEIEGGATLSEAMAKSPKAFNRLYVNMIKAGEAGGALEVILKRLAEFQERSETLKRKVKGALVYPVVVISFASGILIFIMSGSCPSSRKSSRTSTPRCPT